ncbi:uncharacterized protein SPAPADRAFT_70418 [Spathaspora passalidarum NRRL Y-27907]|uniref:Uncharacterized protein n=1 Tax=Spathaspora passalidarum (strain NRRL Y-27907 / 11-Y1) TaxID=619300 RepID=G3AHW9_SPAPN|nr:uncharacterized protein SPAPADRAFT_70418 [Spathaspora passalidarum NRRL Y-27907]EGW34283.1 hypothetical protein SPAPADRAFT_70418 [Spathaspora passalidarum NRRL Y-27907]
MFGHPPTSMSFKNDFDLPAPNPSTLTAFSENQYRQQKQPFQMQPRIGLSHQPSVPPPPVPPPYSAPHIHNSGYYQLSNGFSQPPISVPYGGIQKPLYNLEYDDPNENPLSYNTDRGLVVPIPPLHIQQQLVNSSDPIKQDINRIENLQNGSSRIITQDMDGHQILQSNCSRCKKKFEEPLIVPKTKGESGTRFLAEAKTFKLCQHCRDLQRQRSRRWQKKTKDKKGVCRRCGSEIPIEEQKFVLCPSCRHNLRARKANRAAQGRCVHCSGPLDSSILTNDDTLVSATSSKSSTSSEGSKDGERGRMGNYKVCKRCRENDKIRRTNLEKMGNCNRCAKALDPEDFGKHKVCAKCRSRKRKGSTSASSPTSSTIANSPILNNIGNTLMNSIPHTIAVAGMLPQEQSGMTILPPGTANASYPEMGGGQYGVPFQHPHYSQQQYVPVQSYGPQGQSHPFGLNQPGKPLQYMPMNQQQQQQQQSYSSDFHNYSSNNPN